MCGIAGTLGVLNSSFAVSMAYAMAHRGPDDHGEYWDAAHGVALAHRRLSIIDVTAAGHQPMSYRSERYWIVFNGEIYNFISIRRELEVLGHRFRSNSDTEVLVAAYVQWGDSCVEKLRGMFAFAIYDRGDGLGIAPSLFLARDRFGIKPLYYAVSNNTFAFASEIKGILASGMVSRKIDRQAIWQYLSLGSVPQPSTIVEGVKALMPGHVMRIHLPLEIRIKRYWNIAENSNRSFPEAKTLSREDSSSRLRDLLEDAARLHLISDVPVGAFLSGGIDSTAVVGLMSKVSGLPIKTYSVGFEGQLLEQSDLAWARVAANAFGTDHTEVIVTGGDVANLYDNIVHAIDQPSLDGTNTYLVSRAAGQSVKVALSGLGGDELFAGYPHFKHFATADRWDSRLRPLGRRGKTLLLGNIPGRWLPLKELLLMERHNRYATLRNLCGDERKSQVIRDDFMRDSKQAPVVDFYSDWLRPDLDSVSETSYVELQGYLVNTLLRDSDAMAMGNSLEIRPILLDHVVGEFAFALPSHLKVGEKENKPALVDAIRDLMPDGIIERKKMGFELPLTEWLSGPLRQRALAAFSSSIARGIFSPQFLQQTTNQLICKQRPSVALWAYLILIEWLTAHRLEL